MKRPESNADRRRLSASRRCRSRLLGEWRASTSINCRWAEAARLRGLAVAKQLGGQATNPIPSSTQLWPGRCPWTSAAWTQTYPTGVVT